jgi:hypothetical protein
LILHSFGVTFNVIMKRSKLSKAPSAFKVEIDREEDGRWIVEVPRLPGVMAYGATKREALRRVYAIALRTKREVNYRFARAGLVC